jgi:DNA-binding transcriptional regulator YhcF (GntR family)
MTPEIKIPTRVEKIAMSSRRLAAEVGINKDTATKSLKRLTEAIFLSIVSESIWLYVRARNYRLTFKTFKRRIQTNEWASG